MNLSLLAAVTLLAAPPPAAPAAEKPFAVPASMVVDGVPDVPMAIAEKVRPYSLVRSAGFQAFAPDGAGVYLLTRFGETAQVHHVVAPTQDREQLTFQKEPVRQVVVDPAQPGGFYYSADSGGGEFYQLYWFDLGTGRPTRMTDGKSRNEGLMVSHQGHLAGFFSTARTGKDFDLYTMKDHDPATVRLVKELDGQWQLFDWSPDGTRVLLNHFISANEQLLFVLDLASGALMPVVPPPAGTKVAFHGAAFASKDTVLLVSDMAGEFEQLFRVTLADGKAEPLLPSIHWDIDDLAISPDLGTLALTVNEGGVDALYLGPVSAPGKASKVTLPIGVVSAIRFDGKGKRLGFTLSGSQTPGDVFSVDVATRKATRWTSSEVGGLNPSTFVDPERIEFKTFDNKMIPAFIYRPRTASAAHPVPVVISIHGGPEAQFMAAFAGNAQLLVNELGVAVIFPNVRGSDGYGKSYLKLDDGFLREDSVKDIGALLDWVGAQKDLDSKRVAVQGGSYGGYMVLASLTHYSDRLKCGAEIVGISHFVTFLEHTEGYRRDLRRVEYGDERDPKMREFLNNISPVTNAAKIHVPLLVAQGANDPRVPASEAEQIVKTVRGKAGTVWSMLAKDEGHGYQKLTNRDYHSDVLLLFYSEYLLK